MDVLLFLNWSKVVAVQVHNSSPSNFRNAEGGGGGGGGGGGKTS